MTPRQEDQKGHRAKPAARALGAAAAIAPLLAAGAHADDAQAKTFKVKNTKSHGKGTLNKAIKRANRHKGSDRVIFRSRLSGDIKARRGKKRRLEVTDPVKIVGSGKGRVKLRGSVKGSQLSFAPKSKKVDLDAVIKRLTLKGVGVEAAADENEAIDLRITSSKLNGKGISGAGIRAQAADDVDIQLTLSRSVVKKFGKGINLDFADAKIDRSTIAKNTPGGGVDAGFYASAKITKSTISGNALSEARKGAPYGLDGGGVYSDGYGGRVQVSDSTISGNSATGAGAIGGGLFGQINVTASTVTDNSAPSGGGVGGHQLRLSDSIVAGNSAPNGADCFGVDTKTSEGGNVLGPEGCGTPKPSDVLTDDPGLGSLADNGGPTRTHALSKGSPAIDHSPTLGLKKDQRGIRRGKHPDSGSFERR